MKGHFCLLLQNNNETQVIMRSELLFLVLTVIVDGERGEEEGEQKDTQTVDTGGVQGDKEARGTYFFCECLTTVQILLSRMAEIYMLLGGLW